MHRLQHARVSDVGDLDAVVSLALSARSEAGITTPTESHGRIARQMRSVLTDPGVSALVTEADDGTLVGFALARPLSPSVVYDLPRLHVEAFYVIPAYRRRGYGRALLRGALEYAERVGAPDVTVLPLAGDRTIQRFLARLGFVQAASHRVIDTASLAERLDPAVPDAEPIPERSSVAKLIASRRRHRPG